MRNFFFKNVCASFARKGQTPVAATPHLGGLALAFGPQHPAAHGILRLTLALKGEILSYLEPFFGYLHRGTEKLAEARALLQTLPYFDRFDYVANLFQEHAFCLAVEALLPTAGFVGAALLSVRVLFDEISRVLNHLLTLSATALDLGAMGPIFWAFEEREYAFELLERASGARMHTALHRPFQFDFTALTPRFVAELARMVQRCTRSLAGAFLGLLNNRAFKTRLGLVGQLSSNKAADYGITGIILRSAGTLLDWRAQRLPYAAYANASFRSFLGRRGDNLDRFLGRVKEVAESLRLLSQQVTLLAGYFPAGQRRARHRRPLYPQARIMAASLGRPQRAPAALHARKMPIGGELLGLGLEATPTRGKHASMEALIAHFKVASGALPVPAGVAYAHVESPKGEVGVFLLGEGAARPARLKLRTPVSHNMHLIPSTSTGTTLADFVATFCAYDIVLGEIDR